MAMSVRICGIIVVGIFPAGGDAMYDAISVALNMWAFSIPLGILSINIFHWSVMVTYLLVMADEVIKLPWLYPRYKKYIWVRNLTREEA